MKHDYVSILKSFSDENKSMKFYIEDVKIDDTSTQFTSQETWEVKFKDENFKTHKMKFNMPKVDKNGFLKINGDIKILKKQWFMIPIAKISPDKVFVTSNLNKVMVYRQGSTLNHNTVILYKLITTYFKDNKNILITIGNNERDNENILTNIEFDFFAKRFYQIVIKGKGSKLTLFFNIPHLLKYIEKHEIKYNMKNNMPFAILETNDGKVQVIDLNPLSSNDSYCVIVLSLIRELGVVENFDSIITNINVPKRRVYSRITIQSKKVPLILFLSSLFGLKRIISYYKSSDVFFSEKRIKDSLMPFVKLKDGYLYYNQYPLTLSLLFNGLTELNTEDYTFEDFETQVPAIDYIYAKYKTRNIMKGWTFFKEFFLDPITIEVLGDLKLPTDFLEVFLYVNDLLGDNNYTDETDVSLYRVRGYEVLPVLLYKSMTEQYSKLKKEGYSRESFTIPDNEIIKRLHKSFILENYDAINPMTELKSKSLITFKGPNGVNESRAFQLKKRAYGRSMIGTIGMSSVDSNSVGIIKYLTMNPRITSTRGYIDPPTEEEIKNMKLGNIATIEEAVIPFVNKYDDPKRVGFASKQTVHVIPTKYSSNPLVGSGADKSLIYLIGDTFGAKAKKDGVCTSIDEKNGVAIIAYEDGTFESVYFKEQLNRNSNMYLTNTLVLNVKEGQKVSAGDVLTYNDQFFSKLPTGEFVVKQGPLCRLVVMENDGTEEDSSDITTTFAKKLSTDVVKRIQIPINAQSNIISYKQKNDYVIYGDSLIIYEETEDENVSEILSKTGDIDESVLDSIARHKSKSKETGFIRDMKVYWTIPPEEMSESCRKFVQEYIDAEMKIINFEEKQTGKKSERRLNIQVSEPIRNRIRGVEVNPEGSILVEYYIGDYKSMGPGDKLVYYSSLKSIVAHVIPQELEPYSLPENKYDDTKVDAVLGFISIGARMVMSIWFAGFLGNVLFTMSKRISKEFLEEIGEEIKK